MTSRSTNTLTAALIALAVTVTTACGVADTGDPTLAPSTTTMAPPDQRPTETVDEHIATENGRMHLRCTGSGDATVLLLAGWDADRTSWDPIQPPLAKRTRVCSYSRFGTGTSDEPTRPQTFETQATDLHALLEAAGEPGPYVVVGHSFGGPEAVTFAHRYPGELTGLMLIDASPVTWPATACSVHEWAELCSAMHDPDLDAERLDVFPAFEAVAAITSLGDLPMAVITAAHRDAPALAATERARLDSAWADGVERWASLSSASKVVTVEDTGHQIQLEHPQLVIDAVTELLP